MKMSLATTPISKRPSPEALLAGWKDSKEGHESRPSLSQEEDSPEANHDHPLSGPQPTD